LLAVYKSIYSECHLFIDIKGFDIESKINEVFTKKILILKKLEEEWLKNTL